MTSETESHLRQSGGMPKDRSEEIADEALAVLASNGIALDPALSVRELSAAEERVGVAFPPDLAALLRTALPVGERFPTWRDLDGPRLRDQLEQPVEGIVFDVLHNGFWHPGWSARPADTTEAEEIARSALALAPALVPIYGHRYLPLDPHAPGNPVLSVMQTDIIFYGANLAEYASNEFQHGWREPGPTTKVPFWDYFPLDY